MRRRLHVRGRVIAVDCEATGLLPYGGKRREIFDFGRKGHPDRVVRYIEPARAFAWSFCDLYGNTDYLRGKVDPITRKVTWKKWQRRLIRRFWGDERVTKIGHNPRYDINMAEAGGATVRGQVIDTQIIAHTATAGHSLTYALKEFCKKRFKFPDDDEKTLMTFVNRLRQRAKARRWSIANKRIAGKSPAKADMWLAPDRVLKPYAVGDVIRCVLIYKAWWDEIQANPKSKEVCDREHRLLWTLKDMEDVGARVFRPRVKSLIKFYQQYQQEQVKIAEAHGGKGLNYGSTPQMSKVFYEVRHHQPQYTKTYNHKLGRFNYGLNGDQLLKMATGYVIQRTDWRNEEFEEHGPEVPLPIGAKWVRSKTSGQRYIRVPPDPLAKAVLEYKAAKQTVSSFLEVYRRYWVKESPGVWVLHPGYKQSGAKTGRLSCADPNLQQVASETTGRRKADIQSRPREAFGPRPGHMWYLPDYSQIEVWLFAFLSGEKRMQKTLMSGEDYHGGIAKRVFGNKKDFDEAKDYYRKCAKLIMFCLLYGGGVPKAAKLLKQDVDTASQFVSQYHATLPGVKKFMSKLVNEATLKGEIFNPFGRRYLLDKDFAYRAVNYMIQGTAADVMKEAMIQINDMLKRKGYWRRGVRLLLTVHDEVIIEVPTREHSLELMISIIRAMQTMSTRLGLPVPLPVEMKIARTRWSRTTKIKLPSSITGGAPKKMAA